MSEIDDLMVTVYGKAPLEIPDSYELKHAGTRLSVWFRTFSNGRRVVVREFATHGGFGVDYQWYVETDSLSTPIPDGAERDSCPYNKIGEQWMVVWRGDGREKAEAFAQSLAPKEE